MAKTNIKLNVITENKVEYVRVKVDGQGFPCFVIDNEKIIINSTDFPMKVSTCWGYKNFTLELISGLDELKSILENPELTRDKISLKQQMRLTSYLPKENDLPKEEKE